MQDTLQKKKPTETGDELFNDHIQFAFWIFDHKYPWLIEDKDAEQSALIGLWKASQTYDEQRNNNFRTYASKVIVNQIRMYLRNKEYQNRLDPVSLDYEYESKRDTDQVTFADSIPDEDPFTMLEWEQTLPKIFEMFTNEEQRIIHSLLEGKGQREVAKMFGTYEVRVHRIRKRFRKMVDTIIKERAEWKSMNKERTFLKLGAC